jgi:L-methionine (R)-S-oxide reductase
MSVPTRLSFPTSENAVQANFAQRSSLFMTLLPVRPIATINAVDESRLLEEVRRVLEGGGDRERKAAGIASAIRRAGDYRWVGVYEVTEEEIANLAFSGPGAPAHPRFPTTQGLSGSAVASGETVVVGNVREDPRYLTAFGSTRSEIIVPVFDRAGRKVVGTIDVESERVDAFSEEDRAALERCAVALAELFG